MDWRKGVKQKRKFKMSNAVRSHNEVWWKGKAPLFPPQHQDVLALPWESRENLRNGSLGSLGVAPTASLVPGKVQDTLWPQATNFQVIQCSVPPPLPLQSPSWKGLKRPSGSSHNLQTRLSILQLCPQDSALLVIVREDSAIFLQEISLLKKGASHSKVTLTGREC